MNVAPLILVLLLGAGDYRCRTAAHAQLVKLVAADTGIGPLLAAESHPCPEIRYRAQVLLRPWFQRHAKKLAATALPKGWKQHPWIDSLPHSYCGRYGIIEAYLRAAREAEFFDHPPEWRAYREATRAYIANLITARVPVQALLEEMAKGDLEWLRRNGKQGDDK